ncbi:hypothetical protein SDRG_01723 [Saprolegnia diclina VS20]|uniref:Uncharacterized protein n=1 Tax=Saprolegnia diclina (strain VS20) TaxID=1156394 RepID=T0SCQ8_SAPDV|nr:hypothetical protein SDRG_01723 [Saprolegnia diclina VS20]EQC40642.1 hypothetical protein SDRG_01723 [Saprolegnia diclina VS20]|eukprot:XP_008605486.1 hypothetical protein SDRG_01723 [Saprolegnia diclina VS20]
MLLVMCSRKHPMWLLQNGAKCSSSAGAIESSALRSNGDSLRHVMWPVLGMQAKTSVWKIIARFETHELPTPTNNLERGDDVKADTKVSLSEM